MPPRMIVLELNELCPSLLDTWIGEGRLPNFRALRDESEVFVTAADTQDPAHLEPWIQWYSIHTGLPESQHGVFHLTDGPAAGYPDVWTRLRDAGKKVMNWGSMNAARIAGPGAVFLPDPWCRTEAPYPEELQVYQRVVAAKVQEYTNPNDRVGTGDLARFLGLLVRRGLTAATVGAIIAQLAGERVGARNTSWRRVALLDRLQYDLFAHYWRAEQPDFSTFFANSTAHLQHAYWRHMAPAAFTVQPPEEERATYAEAILFGYRAMDAMVGRFRKLAGPDTTIVFASALSQQPYLKYEGIGGHRFYRPRKVESLLVTLGVKPLRADPVMTHQYMLTFPDAASRAAALARLKGVALNGVPLFGFDEAADTQIYFGVQLRTAVDDADLVSWEGGSAPFRQLFYRLDAMKSGRHHPDGCFWVQSRAPKIHADKISILEILPRILAHFGVPSPDSKRPVCVELPVPAAVS